MNQPPNPPSETNGVPGKQQQQPSLLVPTKVNQFAASDGSDRIAFEAFPRGQASRWTTQPVLEWIESLAAATEANDRRGPMMIGGTTLLSEPSPPLPHGSLPAQLPTDQLVTQQQQQQQQQHDLVKPRLWDLSYIDQHDPMAWTYTRQIYSLAVQFEDLAGVSKTPTQVPTEQTENMMAAYRILQTRVEFTFGRIMGQQPVSYPPSIRLSSSIHHHSQYPHSGMALVPPPQQQVNASTDGDTRVLLDALYQETIRKLQSLIAEHHPNGSSKPSVPSRKLPSALMTTTVKTLPTSKPQSKQEFAKYMTAWLRDNWTNPYPDDQVLAEMAAQCGTTIPVISNWLINARTRKWRPAIIKATELGRPSDLLQEDSINIFEGKPVREITSTDEYNHHHHHHHHHQELQQHLLKAEETDDQDEIEFEEDEEAPRKRFRSMD